MSRDRIRTASAELNALTDRAMTAIGHVEATLRNLPVAAEVKAEGRVEFYDGHIHFCGVYWKNCKREGKLKVAEKLPELLLATNALAEQILAAVEQARLDTIEILA